MLKYGEEGARSKPFTRHAYTREMQANGWGMYIKRPHQETFFASGCSRKVQDETGRPYNLTQGSLPLECRIVQLFTVPKDCVIDACSGTGTVMLAATLEGRYAFGFDNDVAQLPGLKQRLQAASAAVWTEHSGMRRNRRTVEWYRMYIGSYRFLKK